MKFLDLLSYQKIERYQSLIFIRPQGKRIIEHLNELLNEVEHDYIDIFECLKNKILDASKIQEFNVDSIKDWLHNYNYNSDIVVIDNIEIILSTYSESEIQRFLNYVDKDKFKPLFSQKIFIFILPDLVALKSKRIYNENKGITRVYNINEISY